MQEEKSEEITLVPGETVRAKASNLSRNLNYSADVISRLSFFYGFNRAINIIKALKAPPQYQTIRVNALKKDPEEVNASLKSVEGMKVRSSVFDDVFKVKIEGPQEVPKTDKVVVAKDKSSEKVMLGANLYHPGVRRIDGEIQEGERVNVKTQFGDIIALGESNFSASEKQDSNLMVRVSQSKYYLPNLENLEAFQRGWVYSAPLISTQALKWFDPIREKVLCIYPDFRDLAYVISLSSGEANITVVTESRKEEMMIKEGLRDLKMEGWESKIRWISKNRFSSLREKFDAALITPKSSKVGIRPRISGYLKEEDIVRLSREARSLVKETLSLIKTGGRLLFLLPSVDPGEGEENVDYFVKRLGLEVYARERIVGHQGVTGYPHANRVLRSYPDQDEDEGWFAALLFKQ